MIPPRFDYHVPRSLPEALDLLQEYGADAKILAGGHSLIPMMKLRLASPGHLIDINRLPGLEYIRESEGFLRIGALTREVALEESEIVRDRYPLLLETAQQIADPQVRNLATVGGNLAHGDPGNDHPATMLALDASLRVVGPSGARDIPIQEFFLDFFQTALKAGEILTEIQVPIATPSSGGAYCKLERKVGDFATAGVAAQLTLAGDGTIRGAGIGLTNVGPTPIKAKRSEEILSGKPAHADWIAQAARLASEDCQPSSDLRGPVEYKRAMIRELTRRALDRALERAQGGR